MMSITLHLESEALQAVGTYAQPCSSRPALSKVVFVGKNGFYQKGRSSPKLDQLAAGGLKSFP